MHTGKKKRPISPEEAARRKQVSQKQIGENHSETSDDLAIGKGKTVFTPPKGQMFRHQGR